MSEAISAGAAAVAAIVKAFIEWLKRLMRKLQGKGEKQTTEDQLPSGQSPEPASQAQNAHRALPLSSSNNPAQQISDNQSPGEQAMHDSSQDDANESESAASSSSLTLTPPTTGGNSGGDDGGE